MYTPEEAAKKLLSHVVRGEQDEAKAMIAANPRLLLIRTKAEDYSGRIIHGTAFQAALGAEDKPMWQMIQRYFNSLEKKEEIESAHQTMKAQFDEQYPSGIEVISATKLRPIYNTLAKAIKDNADNGDSAIKAFRVEITKQNEITSGKHFNMQHLIAAYQAYIENFNSLYTWDNCDKFWLKVIGYVQRQMPANYAQAYCSGLQTVLDNPMKFKRTLAFYNRGNFFPLSQDSGLGFDIACGTHVVHSGGLVDAGSRACFSRPYRGIFWAGADVWEVLENHVKQKQLSLERLESELSQVRLTSQSNAF